MVRSLLFLDQVSIKNSSSGTNGSVWEIPSAVYAMTHFIDRFAF